MADITICLNYDCPMAKDCYRHEAKWSDHWQSVADFNLNEDGTCDHFSPINEHSNQSLKSK